jgi:glycerol uptake facilitator protein
MLVQQLAEGTVEWGQLPVCVAAELLAGTVAALAYFAVSRTPPTPPPRWPRSNATPPAQLDQPS